MSSNPSVYIGHLAWEDFMQGQSSYIKSSHVTDTYL